MLIFDPGWDSALNNNANPALAEGQLDEKIREAVKKLKQKTNEDDFLYLATVVGSADNLLKAHVTKGLHQETGNAILSEVHTTVEVPIWPPRTYHIWFFWCKIGKEVGWHPTKISYEFARRQYRHVEILG
jgi:hypothetical protein